MDRLDIAIAGCGIAGLTAALLLESQGHGVTIYERFPEPRPVGSGLMIQPSGMAVLDQLGLAHEAVSRGAAVQKLYARNREGEASLEADYADLAGDGLFGLGIHRASLFAILYDKVLAAGITIATDHDIRSSEICAGGRRMDFSNRGASPVHDLLIDCLGVGSVLSPSDGKHLPFGALWTTLKWPEGGPFDETLLEQRCENALHMVGVLPTGRREKGGAREFSLFWSQRQQDHQAWRDAGLESWKGDVTGLWPQCESIIGQIESPEQMTFARYAQRTFATPVEERLIHIGDAWHSASPQLGQGANMALLDAWALGQAMAGDGDLQAKLERTIALRRSHVRLYQFLTAAFTPLYQSGSKWPAVLRDLIFTPASRIAPGPALKATLVAGLGGAPLKKLGLSLPDYAALRTSHGASLGAGSDAKRDPA